MEKAASILMENWQSFVGFARKRVGDPHLAEDVVQESLLKALQAEHHPTETEDVVAWFYRILRRSIIDLYRRNDARARALEKFQAELPEIADEEAKREICGCLRGLLAELPPQYKEVLERIDLAGSSVKIVAPTLGETANNLTVRLHRARKQLRERVEACCHVQSATGCLDCACE